MSVCIISIQLCRKKQLSRSLTIYRDCLPDDAECLPGDAECLPGDAEDGDGRDEQRNAEAQEGQLEF